MLYNVDFRKTRGRNTIGISFTLFGLLFVGIVFFTMFQDIDEESNYDRSIEAYDVTSRSYYDYGTEAYHFQYEYHYKVGDNEYICTSNQYNKETTPIVYFDSSNPADCSTYKPSNSTSILSVALPFCALPILFIIIGVYNMIKVHNKTVATKRLARKGILVKNIQYTLVESGIWVNDVPLMCISTIYTFPNGETKELKSEPIKDRLLDESDPYCDLLFDPDNYNNYFLDFEITPTGNGNPQILYMNPDNPSFGDREYVSIDR